MKIKIGKKHYLNSDAFSYWISCEYEIQDGKNAGTVVERRVSGYRATFEEAVDSFADRYINLAEIGDFSELVKTINDLKEEVRSWEVDLTRGAK